VASRGWTATGWHLAWSLKTTAVRLAPRTTCPFVIHTLSNPGAIWRSVSAVREPEPGALYYLPVELARATLTCLAETAGAPVAAVVQRASRPSYSQIWVESCTAQEINHTMATWAWQLPVHGQPYRFRRFNELRRTVWPAHHISQLAWTARDRISSGAN